MTQQSPESKFTCLNCQANFEAADLQRAHFKTEWHMYNLKRKVCNLSSISQDDFINKTHDMALPSVSDTSEETQDPKAKPNEQQAKISQSNSDSDSDDWFDEDDERYAEMLANVVPYDSCLFCSEKSAGLEANVKHMELVHGFFIPDEQYVIDRKVLIRYLGIKVGAGATCLWCETKFPSLQSVRLHMLDKDHCKIRYDQEEAIEEFEDFYFYPHQLPTFQSRSDIFRYYDSIIVRRRYNLFYSLDG